MSKSTFVKWFRSIFAKSVPLEVQTCPRRQEGPSYDKVGQDCWKIDRWDYDLHWSGSKHWTDEKGKRRSENIGPNRQTWHHPWLPRSCSYCGGIHPEDAIKLIQEGWEVEGTDKGYKRYLHPPGYQLHVGVMLGYLTTQSLTAEENKLFSASWSPVPPVKLYTPHFDNELKDRFNKALHDAFHKPVEKS